jgi:hypothetical protein
MQRTGIRRELEAATNTAAGASLRPVVWHSIHWKPANRNVRRLQRRIAQELPYVVAPPPPQRAFERLEPPAVKVARAVLRGRGDGNIALLPDSMKGNVKPRLLLS